MPVGPQESVLVPTGARILCAALVAVAVTVLVALVIWGRPQLLLRALPGIGLVAVGAITLFWLPRVRLDSSGIEVDNPFRRHAVPWSAVREIGTRWSMTVHTDEGAVEAWAAPAPGPLSGMGLPSRARSDQTARLGHPERRSPGVAAIVRRQWEARRDADGPGAAVTHEWHRGRLIVLVVLAVLTIVSIAVP